jgi:hypothetical protein
LRAHPYVWSAAVVAPHSPRSAPERSGDIAVARAGEHILTFAAYAISFAVMGWLFGDNGPRIAIDLFCALSGYILALWTR